MVTRLQVKVKTFFKEMQEMTENIVPNPSDPSSDTQKKARREHSVILLGSIVSIEAALVSAGAFYFLSRIFLETPQNLAGAIVIFAITILIAAGLAATAIAKFKSQQWTRGAIITWQILQFVIATSFIQGISEWQPVGWAMIALALGSVFLVFKEIFTTK